MRIRLKLERFLRFYPQVFECICLLRSVIVSITFTCASVVLFVNRRVIEKRIVGLLNADGSDFFIRQNQFQKRAANLRTSHDIHKDFVIRKWKKIGGIIDRVVVFNHNLFSLSKSYARATAHSYFKEITNLPWHVHTESVR